MIVERKPMTWSEKLYFPQVLGGLMTTFRHLFKKKVTEQYPEQKWQVPMDYRGAPTLVKDEEGRVKCVACQLCEFVCPPRAIRIVPMEYPENAKHGKIEKTPAEFDINMLRCIFCGYCQEVCPEEAIFLKKDFPNLTGLSREAMIFKKEKLLEMGGEMKLPIRKWDAK
jgi:NADH-quinone oxidoreductase subunit I